MGKAEKIGSHVPPALALGGWMVIVLSLLLLGLFGSRISGVMIQTIGELGTIALILGGPAVLFALYFALRQATAHAGALRGKLVWYHWLWMLIFVSALVFRVRDVRDIAEEPVDAWAAFRVALVGLVGFVLLMRLGLRKTVWVENLFRGLVGLLAAYCLFCLISTVWSVRPGWTLYKSLEFLIDIVLVAAVVETVRSTEGFKHLFDWTWVLYGLLLASVGAGVLLWPELALYQSQQAGDIGIRLYGVLPAVSANDVGTYGAILALLALCRLLPVPGVRFARSWYALIFVVSVVVLILSQTRSAIAGLLAGVFLFFVFSGRAWVGGFVSFLLMPMLALTGVGGVIWSFLQRGQDESQILSLTGRVGWWAFAWDKFLERPLTGFGAYAGGRFAVMAELGRGGTSTMHSDYLEILVGTGLWGLVPIVIAIVWTWWVLVRFLRHPLAGPEERQLTIEALSILGILTVRSLFMTMLTWHPALNFMVILAFAEFLRRRMNTAAPWMVRREPSASHPSSHRSKNMMACIGWPNGCVVVRLLLPALLVASAAQAGQRSVAIAPGENIQAVVDRHPPGTSFLIKTGVHRMQSVVPRNGDTFTGERGAILNGAELLTAFQPPQGKWVASVQAHSRGKYRGECDAARPACALPEDLFMDDAPLQRVLRKPDLGPGRWFLDYESGQVWMGDDPRGRKVELSRLPHAFSGSAADVTIRGLTIEKYASMAGDGAIHGGQGNGPLSRNWTVEENEIRFNHGAGVRIGHGMKVLRNRIHHNGQLGVAGGGSDALVEGNEIAFNNYAGYRYGWEAGGAKFAHVQGLVLRKNHVHHNDGPGLWTDINGRDVLYEHNRTSANKVAGILHEISFRAVIRFNTVENDGYREPGKTSLWYGAGILIASSSDVEVYGNTVINCMNGIGGTQANRGRGPGGESYLLKNLSVHDNQITQTTGAAAGILTSTLSGNAVFTAQNNRFSNNTYHLADSNGRYFVWGNSLLSKAQWHSQIQQS